MKKRLAKMSIVLGLIIVCLAAVMITACGRPQFGRLPQGARLKRVEASPNYQGEGFANTVPTQTVLNDEGTFSILWHDFFQGAERQRPSQSLPTVKTDLKSLEAHEDSIVWLGHSSFYIQLAGQRILVDPVFSGYGAPFSFLNKTFAGTDLYTAEELPPIDILLISHDHWDHLDYATMVALKDKVSRAFMPLGVGEHFERWGYPAEKLLEGDWHDEFEFENGLKVTLVPSRHYSGRLFAKNKTLWGGFALITPQRRLFLSGDSGYGPHFKEIGQSFGGFDLAVMDGGQYDPRWPYIHMTPEEAVQAARDVRAAALMPGHVGRFDIANHPWDEPFIRFEKAASSDNPHLLTPKIGEPVLLNSTKQNFSPWWKGLN